MAELPFPTLGRREHLTFKGNLKQTRYGWLRLTPAYSVHLVSGLLDERPSGATVLDPFCGTGTTALVCAERGVRGQTTDINPFLIWLTKAKTAAYESGEIEAFVEVAQEVGGAITTNGETPEWLPALHQIDKWWEEGSLHALGRAMAQIRELTARSHKPPRTCFGSRSAGR